MKSFKRLFSAVPEGTAALFFIQIFATLGFAVLYSTLVLYATKHLHLGVKAATTLMGVFGAFNYGLHLFGGYLGGRFLSNRNLFVGGMALQVFGCPCIATGTLALIYVGLAFFLPGRRLNVTCINTTPTPRLPPEDPRRGGADADLSHGAPPRSPRAAEHDGVPDSHGRLADVLVALSNGAERSDAIRSQQRQLGHGSSDDSAAVDPEYQHRLHRARRAVARGAVHPHSRTRLA